MATKSRDNRWIISAGEVAAYTVCPEAWRLQYLKKVLGSTTVSRLEGRKLHKEWNKDLTEAVKLVKSGRRIIALLVLLVVMSIILVGKW